MGTVFDVTQTEQAPMGRNSPARGGSLRRERAVNRTTDSPSPAARPGFSQPQPHEKGTTMSAFTVSKLTIDRCVSAMCRDWQGGKAETLLGKRLMQLNRQAMDERYPDRHAEAKSTDAEVEEYRHTPQAPNPYLFLVALECLRYQCSEGDVPETPSMPRSSGR